MCGRHDLPPATANICIKKIGAGCRHSSVVGPLACPSLLPTTPVAGPPSHPPLLAFITWPYSAVLICDGYCISPATVVPVPLAVAFWHPPLLLLLTCSGGCLVAPATLLSSPIRLFLVVI
jgi:hypothetical protein